jgi:hypothetical protein
LVLFDTRCSRCALVVATRKDFGELWSSSTM